MRGGDFQGEGAMKFAVNQLPTSKFEIWSTRLKAADESSVYIAHVHKQTYVCILYIVYVCLNLSLPTQLCFFFSRLCKLFFSFPLLSSSPLSLSSCFWLVLLQIYLVVLLFWCFFVLFVFGGVSETAPRDR